jgi:hypothetical protein
MTRVSTTVLSPDASDVSNRLSFCLGVVEAAGYTPCFATSYVDDDGTAFAFSAEIDGSGPYAYPAYSVTLHADGRLT